MEGYCEYCGRIIEEERKAVTFCKTCELIFFNTTIQNETTYDEAITNEETFDEIHERGDFPLDVVDGDLPLEEEEEIDELELDNPYAFQDGYIVDDDIIADPMDENLGCSKEIHMIDDDETE